MPLLHYILLAFAVFLLCHGHCHQSTKRLLRQCKGWLCRIGHMTLSKWYKSLDKQMICELAGVQIAASKLAFQVKPPQVGNATDLPNSVKHASCIITMMCELGSHHVFFLFHTLLHISKSHSVSHRHTGPRVTGWSLYCSLNRTVPLSQDAPVIRISHS